MKPKVTIFKFNSLTDLIDFLQVIGNNKGKIDIDQLTLSRPFGEAEMELAEQGYHATVLSSTDAGDIPSNS